MRPSSLAPQRRQHRRRCAGATPRQNSKASAACSTSMPRPSRADGAVRLGPVEEGPRRRAVHHVERQGAAAQHAARRPARGAPATLLARGVDDDVERRAAVVERRGAQAGVARRRPTAPRAAATSRSARSTRPVGDDDLGRRRRRAAGRARPPRRRRRRSAARARRRSAHAGVALDVAHQAGAVGVVADPAVGVEAQRVAGAGELARAACGAATSANASNLNGSVTLQPLRAGRGEARAPWPRSRRAGRAAARRRSDMPVCRANAAWIAGDWLCATGLPSTT